MTYEIRRVRIEEYAYCVNKLRQNVGLETWIWHQILTSQTPHIKYKWPPYATEWNPYKSFLRTPLKTTDCLCRGHVRRFAEKKNFDSFIVYLTAFIQWHPSISWVESCYGDHYSRSFVVLSNIRHNATEQLFCTSAILIHLKLCTVQQPKKHKSTRVTFRSHSINILTFSYWVGLFFLASYATKRKWNTVFQKIDSEVPVGDFKWNHQN